MISDLKINTDHITVAFSHGFLMPKIGQDSRYEISIPLTGFIIVCD